MLHFTNRQASSLMYGVGNVTCTAIVVEADDILFLLPARVLSDKIVIFSFQFSVTDFNHSLYLNKFFNSIF